MAFSSVTGSNPSARRDGLFGFGQVLKSYRDGEVAYPQYAEDARNSPSLAALGPLSKPTPQLR